MNFIKLTSVRKNFDNKIEETICYLNINHIESFYNAYDKNYHMPLTYIWHSTGTQNTFYAKESPEQIINLIKEAK